MGRQSFRLPRLSYAPNQPGLPLSRSACLKPTAGSRLILFGTLVVLFWLPASVAQLPAGQDQTDSRYVWLRADDGLPSSQIYCMLEDSKGFLWLGTALGLSRYDGQHVLSFGIRDGLPHIRLRQLAEDGEGRIWVLTDGALAYLNGDRFEPMALPPEGGRPTLMGIDSEGGLLVSTRGNLYRYRDGGFRAIIPPPGRPWNQPRPVALPPAPQPATQLASPPAQSWVYDHIDGQHALIRIDGNQSRLYPLRYPISQPDRFLAVRDSRDRWLYACDAGIALMDEQGEQRLVYSAALLRSDPAQWRAMLLDKSSRLWVAESGAGLSCWYWTGNASADTLKLLPVKCAQPGRQVEALLQDREGNIWLGTSEDGAAFLPGNASFVRNFDSGSGLVDQVVLSAAGEGNQNIWFGMRAGQVDVLNFAGIGGVGNPVMGRAGNSPVVCLLEAPDGSMLAGSEDGLFRSRYRFLERHGPLRGIRSLEADGEGSVYVGTEQRLYRFDPAAFEALLGLESEDQISRNNIIADRPALRIAARPEGGCWYANEEGLFRFDGFETSRPVVSDGLLAATISDLAVVSGCLAVATRGDGLLLLRDDGFRWQIDALSGLPSNICTDLFVQDEQTLWVASNRGIARLQISDLESRTLAYETYDTKDGLISNEVNALVALRGSVYLGTNSGISIFNETDFKAQSVAPGIYFRGISIAERDTAVLNTYDLAYSQNRISIRFSSIAFNSGNLIQYRYRMVGLDKDWIATQYGEVRYGSLPAGEYTFEVQALNKDGLFSETPATFSLRIRRPWYQSGWFIFVIVLSLAALVFIGYSVLIGQTERSNLQRSVSSKTAELDRKIHELRRSNDELEQFAYIASHDLKEPLRNIANYVQLLQRRLNGKLDEDASQYMQFAVGGVRRMYAMIDGLLLYSGLTKPDPSVAEVDLNILLEQTLASVTAQHRERQVVVTKAALPRAMVNRDQVGELLWQLLDNAIRFNRSEPVLIKVSLQEREDELEICVEDNGIGLEERYHDKVFQIFERLDNAAGQEGSGIGLALSKKIVERHGGRIWYRSEGRGAAFFFTLKKNLRNQTN